MSDSPLSVRLVAPEKEVYSGEASSLVVPAWDGRVGVLPGHAPLITLLGHGELAVDVPGGGSRRYYVAGGVLKVEGDEVTVLTDYAGQEPPEEIPPSAVIHHGEATRYSFGGDPLV